jgi:hypothetical protein
MIILLRGYPIRGRILGAVSSFHLRLSCRDLSSNVGDDFEDKYHLFTEVLSNRACFAREIIPVLTGCSRSVNINTLDSEEF